MNVAPTPARNSRRFTKDEPSISWLLSMGCDGSVSNPITFNNDLGLAMAEQRPAPGGVYWRVGRSGCVPITVILASTTPATTAAAVKTLTGPLHVHSAPATRLPSAIDRPDARLMT